MKEPTRTAVKKLFAFSRNRCAFPKCEVPIVEDSGTVTGIICHIRARSKGGPRFDAKQSPEQRHDFANLILMCSRHSKVIDSEPKLYTAAKLEDFKRDHERNGDIELSVAGGKKADLLLEAYRDTYIVASEVYIQELTAQNVHFARESKKPNINAPAGSIGSDLLKRNYAKHLIDRYNEFASKQPNRDNFKFPAVYSMVEKRYGVKKWELVPEGHFEDLCTLLQTRINETWLGSVNRSKGKKCFSTFEEYRIKYFEKKSPPKK